MKEVHYMWPSHHYLFLFESGTPSHWIDELPPLAEKRWIAVHDFLHLDLNTSGWKQHIPYRVGISQQCSGRASMSGIRCEAPQSSSLIRPFLHEEIHQIVYLQWSVLPGFFSEGMVNFVERNLDLTHSDLGLDTGHRFVEEFLDNHPNWTDALHDSHLFWQLREEGWSMYLVAGCFIQFLADEYGMSHLKRLLRDLDHAELVIPELSSDIKDLESRWREHALVKDFSPSTN